MIDFILHFDKHLAAIISAYGAVTYGILFLIIFCETAFVITPFLPGDSLLFIAGTFAAQGSLSITLLLLICIVAAILGDTLNYSIGAYLGRKASHSKFIKKEYLEKTELFYKKYGKKTIILARFMPIIRTFAPFVAGIGKMEYGTFISYNIIGGIIWVGTLTLAGYNLGNIEFIEKNLSLITLLIIFASILPPIIEYLKSKKTD